MANATRIHLSSNQEISKNPFKKILWDSHHEAGYLALPVNGQQRSFWSWHQSRCPGRKAWCCSIWRLGSGAESPRWASWARLLPWSRWRTCGCNRGLLGSWNCLPWRPPCWWCSGHSWLRDTWWLDLAISTRTRGRLYPNVTETREMNGSHVTEQR